MTEGCIAGAQLVDGQALVDLEGIQRGGLGPAIGQAGDAENVLETIQRGDTVRGRPTGHLYREGNQYHHVADHGRIERVLPKATIELLAEADGEAAGDQGQPPGRVGRQGQGQQHGGDQGAVVLEEQGQRTLARGQQRGLEAQRAEAGPEQVEQGAGAEQPGQREDARHGGQQHLQHDLLGTVAALGVGRCDAGQGHRRSGGSVAAFVAIAVVFIPRIASGLRLSVPPGCSDATVARMQSGRVLRLVFGQLAFGFGQACACLFQRLAGGALVTLQLAQVGAGEGYICLQGFQFGIHTGAFGAHQLRC